MFRVRKDAKIVGIVEGSSDPRSSLLTHFESRLVTTADDRCSSWSRTRTVCSLQRLWVALCSPILRSRFLHTYIRGIGPHQLLACIRSFRHVHDMQTGFCKSPVRTRGVASLPYDLFLMTNREPSFPDEWRSVHDAPNETRRILREKPKRRPYSAHISRLRVAGSAVKHCQ